MASADRDSPADAGVMTVLRSFRRALALALAALLALAPVAFSAPARASLMDIENNVMCVVCDEPLSVAQSYQAYQERDFIRGLIAKGDTKQQIMRQLVDQYGVAVLGKPPAHGFSLTVYILPPAIVVAGLVILAITLPRWRKKRALAAASRRDGGGPSTTAAEQRRLDEELSRFAG
jgi:cytochrome c-type biogenesis protein CcmH